MANQISINYADKIMSQKILDELNNFKKVAMNFFEIDKLSNPFKVKIYDNVDGFINFVTFDGTQPKRYHKGSVATARDGVTHILSFDLYLKDEQHKDCTFDDYIKTLKHEFVHICHEEILKDKTIMPPLLMEGIATQLAGQTKYANRIVKIPCSADDLKYNFYGTKMSYVYAYEIMGYLLKEKSHKDILKLLSEPHKVNIENLIAQTNNHLSKKQATLQK